MERPEYEDKLVKNGLRPNSLVSSMMEITMRPTGLLPALFVVAGLGTGCAQTPASAHRPDYFQIAQAEPTRIGIPLSKVSSMTLEESKKANDALRIVHHVWAHLKDCHGWVVVMIAYGAVLRDTYATGDCRLPRS